MAVHMAQTFGHITSLSSDIVTASSLLTLPDREASKTKDRQETPSPIPNGIPKGTNKSSEDHVLDALRAVNVRNFDTLKDVALAGAKGEPIDDKNYLMERVIQLAADLPLNDRVSATLTHNFLTELWNDLQHPPKSYLGHEYAFRKPDGSNNNILWPHIGAAGQPYARTVKPRKMQPISRPDPGVIFDSILKRRKFKPHPNKISSVLFYLASIIIHDCFHTSHTDFAISETSSYLDLAPLYGSNYEQQLKVRTKKDGLLKSDCFSDSRILGFPPGVGVLLIMFNRFHNQVASNLAKIDENGRFSKILRGQGGFKGVRPLGSEQAPTSQELYDEALFQTARLITTGLYINIVLKDYVRTILNLNRTDSVWSLDPRSDEGKAFFGGKIPEATGNQVTAEFNLIYRWHSTVSERDSEWTEDAMRAISKGQRNLSMGALIAALEEWNAQLPKDPQERPFDNLKRNAEDGRYSDEDLVRTWTTSVEDVAGAFGAAHVPEVLRSVEILGIIQARSWNLASLNEFREYFKLKPHATFDSINPDPHIAQQLERLYGHPDNVELYPGIIVEGVKKVMAPGSGLATNFTISRAILADAVSLVRSDRFYTVDFTPQNLTNFGFKMASYDLDINHGCVIYKLVLNAFPDHFHKNSIYAHYPFIIPEENRAILKDLKRDKLYSFDRPEGKPILHKPSATLSTMALVDPKFDSLWTGRAVAFGGPSEKVSETRTSFAEAFTTNKQWKTITAKFYTETFEKLWKENQYELGGFKQIDLVGEVLNAAHLSFLTLVLGIGRDSNLDSSLLSGFNKVFESAFGDPEPDSLSAKVRDMTSWLARTIESQIQGSEKRDSNLKLTSNYGDFGQSVYSKLSKAGIDAKRAAWQDVLPSAALLLNTLSKLSAQTTEFFLDNQGHLAEVQNLKEASTGEDSSLRQLAREATWISADVTLLKTASAKIDGVEPGSPVEAQQGQVVVVNASPTASGTKQDSPLRTLKLDRGEEEYSMQAYGPELDLAYQVSYISNTVLTGILGGLTGLERVPGPQGRLKKIRSAAGSVVYLNAEESEYVPYPVSMKVRWKE